MSYAEVAVNSPIAHRRTFSYAIPPHISPAIGLAVWVPFGPKVVQGIIFELTDYPAVEETKEIIGVIDPRPMLSPVQVKLAQWISEYYLTPLFDAAALMLPPGFERKLITFLPLSPSHSPQAASTLTQEQRQLLSLLEQKKKVSLREAEKAIGKKKANQIVAQLLRKGLVTRSQKLEGAKVKPKAIPYLHLAVEAQIALKEAQCLTGKAPSQAALLQLLADKAQPIPLKELRERLPCSAATIKALEEKGLIYTSQVRVVRDPLLHYTFFPSTPPILTRAQKEALDHIQAALEQKAFLLFGVTGSGKTEVYLHALAQAIARGKRGIVLVPEIALTPQTIQRFASRFPNRVAVLHSKLSLGEQFDEWQRIRDGEFDVVIGSRSAIFAPQPDLGLIIIDEEHEWTYKQQDQSPRYHAREVALKLAELTRAVVILGSATPDVESFYRTQTGNYQLLRLPHRITPIGESLLPEVEVVDMRHELKTGNKSIFSRALTKAINQTLVAKEQVILFLNRRGSATFIQCRNCGLVFKCRRCDLPFAYHSYEGVLICHHCNYRKAVPEVCPECWSRRIKFLGLGTQKVEEEVNQFFPGARLLRWDRDVTKGKYSHERILDKFLAHEADILIGTQMIAKGLDIPSVSLVGIISADTIIQLPDFRACERTFQLLSQVAGRAGRGSSPGRVIIQTYTPQHYAIAAAAKHDYEGFYQQEITYRRHYQNPPFSQLACLTYSYISNGVCQQEAKRLFQKLKEEIDSRGMPDITLIGPLPAFIPKLRGRSRWQIILRGSHPHRLLAEIPLPRGWAVDIDPLSLL